MITGFRPRIMMAVLAAAALVAACTTNTHVVPETSNAMPWEQARRFAEAMETIRSEHVQPVEHSLLIDSAIRGMAEGLDPYSTYLTPAEFEQVRIAATGRYEGIGIEVLPAEAGFLVINVLESSPAEAAGIAPGDLVLRIDDVELAGASPAAFDRILQGPTGASATLTLRRDGSDPFEVELRRAVINIPSVDVRRLDSGVVYVDVAHFSDETVADLQRALRGVELSAGVVLDLRNNAGGVVDGAVRFVDAFLDAGVIVSTEGRARGQTQVYDAAPGAMFPPVPMVVLVNGATASAAEIVAGALQDHGLAVLLGTPTFGKGAVQSLIPLDGGGALKLTTARYRTPSGRDISPNGIEPDVLAPEADDIDLKEDTLLERAADMVMAMREGAGKP